MNSFISSFKPVIAALLLIAVIETAMLLALRPSDVERSNYLAFNYLKPASTQELVIYEKMRLMGSSDPDVVQVGDSAGYYGAQPDVISHYLNGMRYANLSCCIPMGYHGYYTIADYMFRHNGNIKALVLYVTPAFLPQQELYKGDVDTGPVDHAFGSLWSRFMPPSMALRWRVTDAAYNLFGLLRPSRGDIFPNDNARRIADSIREHNGWVREEDVRLDGTLHKQYWEYVCHTGPMFNPDNSRYRGRDMLGRSYSIPVKEYERFAALAAEHRARFIIMLQPVGCEAVDERWLKARKDEFAELKRRYPDTVIIPEQVFTPELPERFSSVAHFRVGEDVHNFHRVGQALASALGITPSNPPREPEEPIMLTKANAPALWHADSFKPQSSIGLATGTDEENHATILKEILTEDIQPHRVTGIIENMAPNQPYLFSLLFKPLGERGVKIDLGDPVHATVSCDPKQPQSERHMHAIDGDLEVLKDGWFRCWVSMRYPKSNIPYSIHVMRNNNTSYRGEEGAGIMVREARLQKGERLLEVNNNAAAE